MAIWKKDYDLASLNASSQNSLIAHLGIEYTDVGDDYVKATMPVDNRTRQPFGYMHGGASLVLAETLGGMASILAVEDGLVCVGSEINASHLRGVKSGFVTAIAKAVRIGRTLQVWQIDISNELDELVCSSRLTVTVIDRSLNK